jgi:hypothetical protein
MVQQKLDPPDIVAADLFQVKAFGEELPDLSLLNTRSTLIPKDLRFSLGNSLPCRMGGPQKRQGNVANGFIHRSVQSSIRAVVAWRAVVSPGAV